MKKKSFSALLSGEPPKQNPVEPQGDAPPANGATHPGSIINYGRCRSKDVNKFLTRSIDSAEEEVGGRSRALEHASSSKSRVDVERADGRRRRGRRARHPRDELAQTDRDGNRRRLVRVASLHGLVRRERDRLGRLRLGRGTFRARLRTRLCK